MQILIDTREQDALTFQFVDGVSVKSECLKVGDYTARHKDGSMDTAVIERKSIADLFHSFTHEYENEKAKIMRAKDMGLTYVLAVEAPALEVRKGHTYRKGGEVFEVKKSGISQVRQIMTIERKYGISVWWCVSRAEMAFRIQEYFLAAERIKLEEAKNVKARRIVDGALRERIRKDEGGADGKTG